MKAYICSDLRDCTNRVSDPLCPARAGVLWCILCCMPTSWLFLRGAPTLQEALHSPTRAAGQYLSSPDAGQPWLPAVVRSLPKASSDDSQKSTSTGRTVIPDSEEDEGSRSYDEDHDVIREILLEQSRAVAEESQSRRTTDTTESIYLAPPLQERSRVEGKTLSKREDSEDSFSESLLPPPTQQRSRLLGDLSKSFGALGNITEEQSLLNLPSWSFALSSLTRLNLLPSAINKSAYNAPRINILALIDELELPSTMPVKNKVPGGKTEATRAGMTLVDETGSSLQVVMWDDYAEEWAGKHLLRGDVIYVEKIAISEFRGQKQGSTVNGSKVQICFRTAKRSNGTRTDPALRPELDLDWDPVSQRVKAICQLASGM